MSYMTSVFRSRNNFIPKDYFVSHFSSHSKHILEKNTGKSSKSTNLSIKIIPARAGQSHKCVDSTP